MSSPESCKRMQPRAVFVDRDGTINAEVNYLSRVEDFQILPGVPDAIRTLREQGYLVFVVTNQSGISRGFYKEADVTAIHARMTREIDDRKLRRFRPAARARSQARRRGWCTWLWSSWTAELWPDC